MSISAPPICYSCSRLVESETDPFARPTCAAFPEGIPDAIWEDGMDHREPLAGDHGIRFEQHPDSDPPVDEWYVSPTPTEAASTS